MQCVDDIPELRRSLQQWRQQGQRIGFVPTMGNLHEGHLSLVNAASQQCDKVVVSIFVNPLQFNQASDFNAYPKTLHADQQKLQQAGIDLLFMPNTQLMYPAGEDAVTRVSVPAVTEELEGVNRPGHFDGVATVVLKLFNLVQPDLAIFGEKDYQQLLLVKKMVLDLNLPVDIYSMPTQREPDGLAMSSRNSRLNAQQRQQAATLYQVLLQARQAWQETDREPLQIERQAIEALTAAGFDAEYVSFRDSKHFSPLSDRTQAGRVLAAAWLGEVRLIDNVALDE